MHDANGVSGLNGVKSANGVNGATGSCRASAKSSNHPLDPLTASEIEAAVDIIRKEHGNLFFNTVTIQEPRKAEMLAWLADPAKAPKPTRVADVVALAKGGQLFEGLVDLDQGKQMTWNAVEGEQPVIPMEDLQLGDEIVRKSPKVIEQCKILGIPQEDMHKVYCDAWSVGFDERFGNDARLQQGLMYYRPNIDDNQYAYPLDFVPIMNTETQEVVHIDVPPVRRPLSNAPPSNYHKEAVEAQSGYRKDLKPINITQPEGVSFRVDGRVVSWQNWKIHVGFNYREGIVLNNITYNDKGTERSIFYRLSLAEMVVPYGSPEHPHPRKHAFDLGEYGGGYMTNSLALGCDCKGAIRYMDAAFVNRAGSAQTIKNAICIHEEDSGLLYKHTDFRDDSVTVTRGRKLVFSHIFTPANYEYAIYWSFYQDGSVQLEIKLTGILNTAAMRPGEDLQGWATQVYPNVSAQNHQHLFCLRIDPNIDGPNNTVFQVDARRGPGEVGSEENKHGNAFYAHKTKYATPREAMADYDAGTARTWDIANTNRLHPYSGLPASYKLISREIPKLLPREGGIVWKRAGFARHAIHVTKYQDDQLYPAGRHVPQTSGTPAKGLPAWIEAHGDETIDNTDIVVWHTFGVNHFPAPEDFPVMPVEPVTVHLKPKNFFTCNAALDVPPSYSVTPSQVAAAGGVVKADCGDRASVLV